MSIIDPVLQDKLAKLRAHYDDADSWQLFDEQEAALREAFSQQEVQKIPVIGKAIEECRKVIADLETILLNSKDLPEIERVRLFERRENHLFFIGRLSGEKESARIKSISDFLDSRIKIIGESQS